MDNHHFQWANPLFLWSFSIATLNYQRVLVTYRSVRLTVSILGWRSIDSIDLSYDLRFTYQGWEPQLSDDIFSTCEVKKRKKRTLIWHLLDCMDPPRYPNLSISRGKLNLEHLGTPNSFPIIWATLTAINLPNWGWLKSRPWKWWWLGDGWISTHKDSDFHNFGGWAIEHGP